MVAKNHADELRARVRVRPAHFHGVTVFVLYLFALGAAWKFFQFPEAGNSVVVVLATGSIFATFGSAIMTLFGLTEKDAAERIRLNLDILHKDLIPQEKPWRRWPFLSRNSRLSLLDGTTLEMNLNNPTLPFDVGLHSINVDLPSVHEDYFDLPVMRNCWLLWWYRKSFRTAETRRMSQPHEEENKDQLPNWMLFACVSDIWFRVFQLRFARYGTHLGAGVILAGVLMTVVKIYAIRP